MSIPIIHNTIKYFIVDSRTLSMYNVLFCGFLFISGNRYKKYRSFDKNFLVEV